MIGKATPYLMFNGNAKEALEYYKELFEGEILDIQTYADAGYESEDWGKERLIHGKFKKNEFLLMVSDGSPSQTVTIGTNVSLVIDFNTEDEIIRVFTVLKEKGAVLMELQDTFWGAKYAKIKDPYGIIWDLNFETK
ncbi:VOC family protein [Bacillus sinesaloumensis]|uniref:VOC family protein n=1 Tax=Litchfieldia sinesaloumensis TaxID=1926280 RepID=UPI000988654F|nr:VOC family protein [Bacillus sinesaloumensis]